MSTYMLNPSNRFNSLIRASPFRQSQLNSIDIYTIVCVCVYLEATCSAEGVGVGVLHVVRVRKIL